MLPTWPAGALLKRELRTTLRGWLALFALVCVLGGACLFVWASMPMDRNTYALAEFSGTAVTGICSGLAACAFIFVTPLAALSIAGERERDTFTLLHLTLIRPRGLVTAKFLNASGFFLFIAVGLLPIIGVVFFLVGVDWYQLIGQFVFALVFSIYFAAMGMACSAWTRTSLIAIVSSYVAAALCMFAPIFLLFVASVAIWMYDDMGGPGFRIPGDDVFRAVDHGPLRAFLEWDSASLLPFVVWISLLTIMAVVALCLAFWGVRRFRGPRRKAVAKPVDDLGKLQERRKQFPYYLIDPLKRKPPIPDGRNPMFERELHWGLIGRGARAVRVFYITAILHLVMLSILLVGMNPNDWGEGSVMVVMVDSILLVLFAPILTAGAIARESEVGNMDLLRTTLLTAPEILRGKLYSALFAMLPALASCAFAFVVLLFLQLWASFDFLALLGALATGGLCVAFSILVGLFSSILLRRTGRALLLSYGILIALWLVLPGLLVLPMAIANVNGDEYVAMTTLSSPFIAFTLQSSTSNYDRMHDSALAVWWASLVGHALLVAIAYRVNASFFAEHRMRDK